MTPYERVKLSRERTAGTFPLPNVLDCIRYSICELAEMDDALLRQERTGDKRNNDKAHDPRSELGQALYMLLSAAVQLEYQPEPDDYWVFARRIYSYSIAVRSLGNAAECIDTQYDERDDINDAYCAMAGLAALHGWDVDMIVEDTCRKFEAKHAAQEAA